MKNVIKIVAFVSVLLSFTLSFAQNKEVDALIQKIDNKDAYIVLTKTTSPRIHGDAANSIIIIGKTATPELIKVLTNQDKGIIAHFILSEIWSEIWNEEVCCNINNEGNEEVVTINGLEIRIENNTLYSTPTNLKQNQQAWEKMCKV